MNSYLIESSICLACFYAFYWVFLHREKLLSINRFYLLISVAISLVIPLLNFQTTWSLFKSTEQISQIASTTLTETTAAESTSALISVELIYIVGLAISVCLLLIKLLMVKRRLGKEFSFRKSHIDIVEIEGNEAYSFLNTIYIGKELSENRHLKEQIVAHELAHIDGRHTLDMLFFELLKCVYWFNPFSYFYSNSAQLQHEFIADHYALTRSDAKTYEKSLLHFTLSKINYSLVSSFNQHPIQKRLKMIQQLNSNIMNKLKPLFALPILAALFIAFACTEEIEPVIDNPEQEIVIDLDVEIEPSISEVHTDSARFMKNGSFEEFEIELNPTIDPERVTSIKTAMHKLQLETSQLDEHATKTENGYVLIEKLKMDLASLASQQNPQENIELKKSFGTLKLMKTQKDLLHK